MTHSYVGYIRSFGVSYRAGFPVTHSVAPSYFNDISNSVQATLAILYQPTIYT